MSPNALVVALADLWTAVAGHYPDLPTVAVTVGPDQRRTARAWGHSTWNDTFGFGYEVLVLDETLDWSSNMDVLTAVLHPAVHGLNHARGINDLANRGRYHNSKFTIVAQEIGLIVAHEPYNAAIGVSSWRVVGVTPEALDRYGEPLAAVAAAGAGFVAGKELPRPVEAGPHARRDAECGCEPPHRITAPVALLAAAAPRCPDCKRVYQQR